MIDSDIINKISKSFAKKIHYSNQESVYAEFKGMNLDEIKSEILSELTIFIYEKIEILEKVANLSAPEQYIEKAFKNYLIDKNRKKDKNFFSYLRKTIIDNFRNADNLFHNDSKFHGIILSYNDIATPPLNFDHTSLKKITYPDNFDFHDENKISKKKNITSLFNCFIKEIKIIYPELENICVKADDFTKWIFLNNTFEISFTEFNEQISPEKTDFDLSAEDKKSAECAANNILKKLDYKEKEALKTYFFKTNKKTLSEKLGYSSQSGVSELIKKTRKKLKTEFSQINYYSDSSEKKREFQKNILIYLNDSFEKE
ncbi:MAG: hypothetical protein ACQESP_12205 [Candidatus Muiribacteriota bacterium]